jgi:hypothetical protein
MEVFPKIKYQNLQKSLFLQDFLYLLVSMLQNPLEPPYHPEFLCLLGFPD